MSYRIVAKTFRPEMLSHKIFNLGLNRMIAFFVRVVQRSQYSDKQFNMFYIAYFGILGYFVR